VAGVSVGGGHFHHDNIGIALNSAVGATGVLAYGTAKRFVMDELAPLIDLKDGYGSYDGPRSVDVAIALMAAGATFSAAWPPARTRAGY
jgi:hypothetical protein